MARQAAPLPDLITRPPGTERTSGTTPPSSSAGAQTGAGLGQPAVAPSGEDALVGILARAVAQRANPAPLSKRQSGLVQRQIDQGAFARLDHSLARAHGRPVALGVLTRDGDGVACRVRHVAPPGVGFEISANTAAAGQPPVWGAPVATLPAALCANYTWVDEQVMYRGGGATQTKSKGADQLHTEGDGQALTVTEFQGDELAMVHHTAGGGAAAHLTVENAHIGALHHLTDMSTIEGFNKGTRDKPGHEDFMSAYGSARTDNLNFFPNVAVTISLATYLRVIRHAMDHVAGVPTVYGEEVIRSANAMAAAQHMNPAQLYLRTGDGSERHLFRAALSMNKLGLIAVPGPIVAAFAGFDAQPKPQLSDPMGQVVTEGEAPYNALERDLIQTHLPGLLGYLNTF